MRKHFSNFKDIIFIIFALQLVLLSCSTEPPVEQARIATPTQPITATVTPIPTLAPSPTNTTSTPTPTLLPTATPYYEEACTELGCTSGLQFSIGSENTQFDELIIEVREPNGPSVIFHCFDYDLKLRSPLVSGMYSLSDEQIMSTQEVSPILNICGDQSTGQISVRTDINGNLESLSAFCTEPPAANMIDEGICYLDDRGKSTTLLLFPEPTDSDPTYMPEILEFNFTYGEQTHTAQAKPEYTTTYPNGEECEPKCTEGFLYIELP